MPAYGSGTHPYAATAEHSGATMAFVLGLISVLMMPILGPVSWYLGRKAVREIDADSGTTYRNRGLAVAGMVLGIVGTVICALIVLVLIGILVFVVILAAAAPS